MDADLCPQGGHTDSFKNETTEQVTARRFIAGRASVSAVAYNEKNN
jgi:hypothetical protein